MSRVKRGVTSHAKHKKVYKLAKGFRGRRKNTIRAAKAAVEKAGQSSACAGHAAINKITDKATSQGPLRIVCSHV